MNSDVSFHFDYSEEDFDRMGKIADEFFDTKNDETQLPGEEVDYNFCKNVFPFSFCIVKKDNLPTGYSFILPCDEEGKQLFLSKSVNERELFYRILNLETNLYSCFYIVATQIIPSFQRKGYATKLINFHLKRYSEFLKIPLKFFYWGATREGNALGAKISKKFYLKRNFI